MAINLLVTASAIVGFINEAEAAQDELNKAMQNCDNAAQNLLANWKGPAAEAFAREEDEFKMWGKQMDGAARDVFSKIGEVLDTFKNIEGMIRR
ncbi:MAG: hypothetical protein ACOX7B_13765 [Christensenellales bacterium]|jgi:uncharacterized protein YukE